MKDDADAKERRKRAERGDFPYKHTVRHDAPLAADMSDKKFDAKAVLRNDAHVVSTTMPDHRAMRYFTAAEQRDEMRRGLDLSPGPVGPGRSAGRGGPTAKELQDYEERGLTTERKIRRGDYGPPGTAPTDLMPKKAHGGKVKGYASGGSVSSRADGCITKGHTKGKMR